MFLRGSVDSNQHENYEATSNLFHGSRVEIKDVMNEKKMVDVFSGIVLVDRTRTFWHLGTMSARKSDWTLFLYVVHWNGINDFMKYNDICVRATKSCFASCLYVFSGNSCVHNVVFRPLKISFLTRMRSWWVVLCGFQLVEKIALAKSVTIDNYWARLKSIHTS